MHLVKMTSQNH